MEKSSKNNDGEPKKKESIKEAVKERRETAFQLILQGASVYQVAKQYGVSKKSIDRDLYILRKEKSKGINQLKLNERIVEYNESARHRLTRLWAIISDKNTKRRDLLQAIKLLQKEDEMKMERDTIAGILPRTAGLNVNFNQFNLNNAEEIKIEFGDLPVIEDKSDETKNITDESKVIEAEVVENKEKEE